MPTARTGLTAVAFNGKIYTFGGFDSLKVKNVIEVYDPSSNTWQMLLPASISPIYQLLIE